MVKTDTMVTPGFSIYMAIYILQKAIIQKQLVIIREIIKLQLTGRFMVRLCHVVMVLLNRSKKSILLIQVFFMPKST
jgi:hypothetical protein